ncbi:MAG: dephospho-CoA kinase [Agathobacter sp.]|nr:dephospho-CoA kinase [Agathobacter sp.]MDY3796974.1 dephospho-CoA kinase [Agathobacter sp.]
MRFIGITGGVGAGKSAILDYLAGKPKVKVMLADDIAHELMKPDTECYNKLRELFDSSVFNADGQINNIRMAEAIFNDSSLRDKLNAIVHPAVKEYVIKQYRIEKESGCLEWLILEAALLIEEHYDEICDELWYIYTSEENRRLRLKESRGYSDEKIDNIFASQLSEAEYRSACQKCIDNNGTVEHTYMQIEEIIKSYKE